MEFRFSCFQGKDFTDKAITQVMEWSFLWIYLSSEEVPVIACVVTPILKIDDCDGVLYI